MFGSGALGWTFSCSIFSSRQFSPSESILKDVDYDTFYRFLSQVLEKSRVRFRQTEEKILFLLAIEINGTALFEVAYGRNASHRILINLVFLIDHGEFFSPKNCHFNH